MTQPPISAPHRVAAHLWVTLIVPALGCGTANSWSEPPFSETVTGSAETASSTSGTDQVDVDTETSGAEAEAEDTETSDDEGGAEDTAGCQEINCDPGADDCPNPDDTCMPWRCGSDCFTDSTRCVPQTGQRQLGETCTRDRQRPLDDCDRRLFCMPDDGCGGGGGPGRCVAMCTPEIGGPGNCLDFGLEDQHCFNLHRGSLPLCLPTCDPLGDDCPRGQACHLAVENFFCAKPTGAMGSADGKPGQRNDGCTIFTGCEPGLVCLPANTSRNCRVDHCGLDACACCLALCDLGSEQPGAECVVEDGEMCVDALNLLDDALEELGVCARPY